jgi:O-antigen ligase
MKRDDKAWPFILVALGALVLLRLFIWKSFFNVEPFIKEDASNLICAAAILGVAAMYYGRKAAVGLPFQNRSTGLEGVLGIYFALAAVSFFPSVDHTATLRQIVILFAYLLFFFMLSETSLGEVRRPWVLLFLLVVSFLIACGGLKDYVYLIHRQPNPSDAVVAQTNDSLYHILMTKRVTSLFGWPNVLAGYLGLVIPLAAATLITSSRWWIKVSAGIVMVVMLACLLLTFSFLGWTSLIIGFIAAGALFVAGRSDIGRELKTGAVVFGVVVAVLFAVVVVKKNFSSSVTPRKQYLSEAVKAIEANPFLGTGLDSFRFASSKFAETRDGLTAYTHNSYLHLWVEAGLPGFLAGLAVAFWVLWLFILRLRRQADPTQRVWSAAFVWAFVGFFVDNIWSFTFIKPNISFFFWVILGFACSCGLEEDRKRQASAASRPGLGALVVIIIIGLAFCVRATSALLTTRDAMDLERQGQYDRSLEVFRKARAIDPTESRIAFESGKRYVMAYQRSGNPQFLKEAEGEFMAAAERSPFYGSRLLLGVIYRAMGRNTEASMKFNEALLLAPFEAARDIRLFEPARR